MRGGAAELATEVFQERQRRSEASRDCTRRSGVATRGYVSSTLKLICVPFHTNVAAGGIYEAQAVWRKNTASCAADMNSCVLATANDYPKCEKVLCPDISSDPVVARQGAWVGVTVTYHNPS